MSSVLRVSLQTTRFQSHHGITNPDEIVAPEAIFLGISLLERPESAEVQLDVFVDNKVRSPAGPITAAAIPTMVAATNKVGT